MKKRDCGVYKFVHSLTQQVIYIGKTEDSFKNRINAHFRGKGVDAKFLPYTKDGCEVYIHRLVNDAEKRLVGSLEIELINLYKPILNDENKCEGLSLFLDLKKFEWEKWEDDSDNSGNNITKGEESSRRKQYDFERDEIKNSHDDDGYYICAINDEDDNEHGICVDDHFEYGNSGIKVEHGRGYIVVTIDESCKITFSGWDYNLEKLRAVLQAVWKDWEKYKDLNDGESSDELFPHVSCYPEWFRVKFKRGEMFCCSILAVWQEGGNKIKLFRKNVWIALKMLDIIIEDSGDKIKNIKKLFDDEKYAYSELVYHPCSEIMYCQRSDDNHYEIELEGKHITFSTGFIGNVKELKQIVDKTWQYCIQERKKYVTSNELPYVLEFPNSLFFKEGYGFQFDVIIQSHKGKRKKTAVSIEAVRKMKRVLDILTDKKNEKTRRVEEYLKDDMGNSASLDTTF